jgi:hypothetical protein
LLFGVGSGGLLPFPIPLFAVSDEIINAPVKFGFARAFLGVLTDQIGGDGLESTP